MFRSPIKEVNAEFPAEDKYLDSIRRVVKESCASGGMSRKDTAAVLLAIEEGATNIIRHAYLYERGMLRLRIVIYKKLVAFSLIDTGRSFQPSGSGKIDLDRLVESGRKGGLGFYMIQKIMDSVEYISSAGYNELRMLKRVHEPVAGTAPILRRLFTLRMKFSVFTFVIVALIVGSAFYYVDTRTRREVYAHLDATVTALSKTIAEQASGYMINRRSDVEFDELLVSYVRSNAMLTQVVLIDSTGLVLAHSDDIRNIRKAYDYPEGINARLLNQPQRIRRHNEELNCLILPIKTGERQVGTVNAIYTSAPLKVMLTDARRKTLSVTAVLLLIGVTGIYLLSNYFVTPIVKITQRVRRFSSGDLETELPLEGADEFFEISRALNDMITRLSRDRRNIIERERMAKEIEVASQIQKTLMPSHLPRLPGLEIETFYRAASIVGGDLFDVFEIGPQKFCLVVADVSGKGVPASLVMSMLRTVIQIQAKNASCPRSILISVNDYLVRNIPAGMFITVLMGLYDAAKQELSVVSAGHNPMLVYRSDDKQSVRLNPAGMPLGLSTTLGKRFDESLEVQSIELKPGDTFLMYTDGITEATDRQRNQYGVERLETYLSGQLDNGSAPDLSTLSRKLVEEIDTFSSFARQADDITFILARAVPAVEPTEQRTVTVTES